MAVSQTIGGEHQGEPVPISRIALASCVGTVIEAYDFVLYGAVAALVFDELFFPNVDPVIGTLAAFATFGVGFLARPVGGVIFGHYGDRVGRKSMLIITLLVMGIATILIGCLPGYDSVGILAPILLVTLRLIQGLAIGGEWGGAVLMVTEHAPKGRRGFYGSWPQIGFSGGLLLATGLLAILSNTLSDAAFESWGWRVPFVLSGVLVGVGLWVRLKIEETPAFAQMREQGGAAKLPAVEAIRTHRGQILRAVGMRFSENITFYMISVFALSYGEDELGISRNVLLTGVMIAAALSFIAVPAFGALSDRVGRRRVYFAGALSSVAIAVGFFALLQTGSPILIVLGFVLAMNTAHDAQYGTQAAFFSELFSTRVRYSGLSISAQLGGVLAGAFAPLIATALLAAGGGDATLVVIYFAAMCSVSAVAAWLTPETFRGDFDEVPERAASGRFDREREPDRVQR
jgi:metabolite-proton symporter